MYYADSRSYTIWSFDLDQETGEISNRRTFITMSRDEGLPDGAAVDSQGFYWTTKFMGRRIVRYDPAGKLERTIPVPFDNPTMVAFGGSDYKTMYISSGRGHLTPDELEGQPLAGGIFKMQVDVAGLPEPSFHPLPALETLPAESLL
jgi:sugar lactone lactonase YvrE